MPIEIVSPGNQRCISGFLNARFFHAVDGSTPVRSPSRSMPVICPKPNGFMKFAIMSIGMSAASM